MWYYWHCMYGPGHQGSSDGFEWFDPEDWTKGGIDSHFESMFNDKFGHTCQWSGRRWPVKKVPQSYLDNKIKKTKERIKYLRQDLKFYQDQQGLVIEEEDGIDETVTKNIKGRPKYEMLKKLHRAGIIVREKTLESWAVYYPENDPERCKKPVGAIRDKILKIVRRVETYDSFNARNK